MPVNSAETTTKRYPPQQIGLADDVARVTAFPLSDASRFLTRQVPLPDGWRSSSGTF